MRYEPSQRLLRLALLLAGTRTGLTLDEMTQGIEVGRRTAERQRDALAALFPQLEFWAGVAEPRAESVAAVEAAARACAGRGEADPALACCAPPLPRCAP